MRRINAICRKELQMYLLSPTAYVAFAFYFLVTGLFFSLNFLSAGVVDVRMLPGNYMIVFLLVVPMLTMRLVADEFRNGTDELLLTSPASITEIVLGKYLAALAVQVLLILGGLIYPWIMSSFGPLDQPVMWLSYLSLLLLGAAMMAVGLFASTLSAQQMVSGIAAFALILFLWMIDWLGNGIFTSAADALKQFSIAGRVDNLQKGVFDLPDVLFYISLIILFIVLSIQSLERKRWR